jgi:hypothetical protein
VEIDDDVDDDEVRRNLLCSIFKNVKMCIVSVSLIQFQQIFIKLKLWALGT